MFSDCFNADDFGGTKYSSKGGSSTFQEVPSFINFHRRIKIYQN